MANVHLDATEHQDHVVFLHHIQEGPANRSYGIQVAKLAGIPAPVLAAAQEKLLELERGASGAPRRRSNAGAAPPRPSHDLFGPCRAPPGSRVALEALDVGRSQPPRGPGNAVRTEVAPD